MPVHPYCVGILIYENIIQIVTFNINSFNINTTTTFVTSPLKKCKNGKAVLCLKSLK